MFGLNHVIYFSPEVILMIKQIAVSSYISGLQLVAPRYLSAALIISSLHNLHS